MELRHLDSFVAVAEELHFARAAQRLQIAQQPLSQQIRRLEDELGVVLFERTTRRVALTNAGQVFLEEARRTLAQAERAIHEARRAERGEVGRLTIGYVSTALYNTLPWCVRQFHQECPDVALTLREYCSPELEEQVEAGVLDVGFVGSPVAQAGLAQLALVNEPAMVVLPLGHPLAALPAVPQRALAGQPFIQYARDQKQYAHDLIVHSSQQAGFALNIVQEAASEQAVIGLVAAGLGVSVVSASLQQLRTDEVCYRPLSEPDVDITYSLVWRCDDTSPVVRGFVALARAIPLPAFA